MIGFCVPCADDVPMSLDRRCLADGSLVLPPSTGCAHQRWLDGSWSTCSCKPVKTGTWRAILKQQDKAVERRDKERAARMALSRRYPTPEIPCPVCTTPFSKRLSRHGSTRKTCSKACGWEFAARTKQRLEGQRRAVRRVTCVTCGEKDRPHKARGLCPKCWSAERRRSAGAKVYAPPTTLEPVPCPVCSAPFKRVIRADGQRQKTCSKACGLVLKTGRRYLGERWSRQHDACVQCGTTTSRHHARGVCTRCTERARRTNKQSEAAA